MGNTVQEKLLSAQRCKTPLHLAIRSSARRCDTSSSERRAGLHEVYISSANCRLKLSSEVFFTAAPKRFRLAILSGLAELTRPLQLRQSWDCTMLSSPLSLREFGYAQRMM